MKKSTDDWVYRWRNWVRPTRTPGLYELQTGGFLYRRLVTDPTTGKRRETKRVIRDVDETRAALEMQKAVVYAKSGMMPPSQRPKLRFAEFAASLYEQKVADKELKTPASVRRWKDTLPHLLAVTKDDDGRVVIDGLGEHYVHTLELPVKHWRTEVQQAITDGLYAPSTANGWLSILRVVTKEVAHEFKLTDPCARIKDFDTSEHATYSEEAPNSLPPERAHEFLELMREHFPQHFAMTFLGFITGLRPSSLRPLRRRGLESDVKWEACRLVVRRSQTYGEDVTRTTKQKTRYAIDLPQEAMSTLDWHVRTQLRRPEQRQSDLLFPSEVGGFRARSVLDKPFAEIGKLMKLPFRLTPRGMRRTFNDMARLAKLESIVTRSISGHATERMQDHYSTVQNEEQREGIAQVIQLFASRSTREYSTEPPSDTGVCAPACAPDRSPCAPASSESAPVEAPTGAKR